LVSPMSTRLARRLLNRPPDRGFAHGSCPVIAAASTPRGPT
jgi:hypothetical protein